MERLEKKLDSLIAITSDLNKRLENIVKHFSQEHTALKHEPDRQ